MVIESIVTGNTLDTLISSVIAATIAYLFWRIRRMDQRIETMLDKEDIKELIQYRIDTVNEKTRNTEEAIKRVEEKLDLLINQLMKSRK